MKKLLLVLFVLAYSLTYGQNPIVFEKIIQVKDVSKDSIFFALKKWVANEFVSSKAVIEMADKDAGIIAISPNSPYSYNGGYLYSSYGGYISYNISIEIKSGRFKVVVNNFNHNIPYANNLYGLGLITDSDDYPKQTPFGTKKYYNNVWDDLKIKVASIADELFNELSDLNFTSNNKTEDNW